MAENILPDRPLYFTLSYRDCPHTSQIPLGHGKDCQAALLHLSARKTRAAVPWEMSCMPGKGHKKSAVVP